MQIRQTTFNGIAPKQTHLNLDTPYSEVAQDVNLERSTLKSWKTPAKISSAIGDSLYVEDCCVIVGDCDTRFAKTGVGCESILVVTGLHGEPGYTTNICNPEWEPLGFPCDMQAPAISVNGGDDLNFSLELRTYVYTVTNRMGWESAPSLPSMTARVNVMDPVTVGGFTVPRNAVTIRIYRAQSPLDFGSNKEEIDDDAVFLFVGEIPASSASFVDDVRVAGEALVTMYYDPPPDDLREITSWREGRLAGLSGDTFLMTERSLPHAWNRKFAVGFYDKPIALRASERMAYVLTDGRPVVLGIRGDCSDDQAPIEVSEVTDSLPIISRRSAAIHGDSVIYASTYGLVMMRGAEATIVTKDYYTAEQWSQLLPHTMVGEVCDGVYYGATDNATIRFELPSNIYAVQPERALTTLSVRPSAMYTAENSRLYMVLRDGVYEWNAGDEQLPFHWRGKIHDMPGRVRMSAFRIRATQTMEVAHHTNTSEIQRIMVGGNSERLPTGFTGEEWQLEIKGKGEVYEYTIATSLREIA